MHEVLVNCLVKLTQENVVMWTDRPVMTIAVDLGHKAIKQTKQLCVCMNYYRWWYRWRDRWGRRRGRLWRRRWGNETCHAEKSCHFHFCRERSGRVLESRPRDCGFEPHRLHCLVVLEQDTFILAQPRKTGPCETERLLMGRKEWNQTSENISISLLWPSSCWTRKCPRVKIVVSSVKNV